MHDVTRVVMPAGIEQSMTMPTACFIASAVILLEAGSALFLRLCPAFFISHNLLSFRLLLLCITPAPLGAAANLAYVKSCSDRQAPRLSVHSKWMDLLEIH
jgi:hypothetical protein